MSAEIIDRDIFILACQEIQVRHGLLLNFGDPDDGKLIFYDDPTFIYYVTLLAEEIKVQKSKLEVSRDRRSDEL